MASAQPAVHARQVPRVLMLAPQLLALLQQLAPRVLQHLGPAEQPQQLLPQATIVHSDGLGVRQERARRLPLRVPRQRLHALARLALKRCLVLQEAPLHAVEQLRVLHTHMQQLALQRPDPGQLLQLQLLRQTQLSTLVEEAFKVYNNQDLVEEANKDKRLINKIQLLAADPPTTSGITWRAKKAVQTTKKLPGHEPVGLLLESRLLARGYPEHSLVGHLRGNPQPAPVPCKSLCK